MVATARKIVTIALHMLTNNEPHRHAIPKASQAKYDRLRIRATGQKRKGGFAKGSQRPATYGAGNPTRDIPSLAQVYEDAGLPQLKTALGPQPAAGDIPRGTPHSPVTHPTSAPHFSPSVVAKPYGPKLWFTGLRNL